MRRCFIPIAVSRRIRRSVVFWASLACLLISCDRSTNQKSASSTTLPKDAAEQDLPIEEEPAERREPLVPLRDEDDNPRPQRALDGQAQSLEFGEHASDEFKDEFKELHTWVKSRGGRIHAALVDLQSDEWLLRSLASESVNPASNAKLITAAAVLELLGPAHVLRTELFGRIDSEGKCDRLVIRGEGAPDLTTADLWRLLRVAQGQGLREVGQIVVDQGRFTPQFVPPAFEQQPNEWAPFRAPISALAINGNTISLNVVSTRQGEPARVWYDPPGVVDAVGTIQTIGKGKGDRVSWSLDTKKDASYPQSVVGGGLSESSGRRRYHRRLEDPRRAAGLAVQALLLESGVVVGGNVQLGRRNKEPKIALWNSEPLAELIRAMGKNSDNFTAEMLFVALSAADTNDKLPADAPYSSERGAKVVQNWLEAKGAADPGLVIKNGSGLFDANRVSTGTLVKVLASVEDNAKIYQDFVSHLAMGATDGTLKKRMRNSEVAGRIRAKTGTLRNVDALSGYIQRSGGKSPVAFSVIVIDAKKASHAQVRKRVDQLIVSWAKALH